MSARRALARLALPGSALALVAGALAVSAAGPPGRTAAPPSAARTPYADHFPPGAGSDIAARSCVVCHSAMLVIQQAKDSLGWEKTLGLMEKWGAPVAPAEHDSLRAYLLASFGPRRAGR